MVSSATDAAPNAGYIVEGSTAVKITLPAESLVSVGDEVDVTAGMGAAGFQVVANTDEVIAYQAGSGSSSPQWVNETASSATSHHEWQAMASSASGANLVAVTFGQLGTGQAGDIRTSSDYGKSWVNQTTGTAASRLAMAPRA